VRPALSRIGLLNQASIELVMGTAAQESHLQYLRQLGTGPALGLWQMEPATHNDIWTNYLRHKPQLAAAVLSILSAENQRHDPGELAWNLRYAAAMCRVHYLRVAAPLPAAGDLRGQAAYWKKSYNTVLGAGTELEYVRNYELVRQAINEMKDA